MSATPTKPGTCSCGQVVFDLTDRKTGEILRCSWCGQKFRFLGGDQMSPLTSEDAKPSVAPVQSTAPARPRVLPKKADGPPGGVMPMIGFIIAFNVLAFIAFWILLPTESDGVKHAIWDHDFTVSTKALWPDLTALGLGHLLGFTGWAMYVYRLHKRQKTDAKP